VAGSGSTASDGRSTSGLTVAALAAAVAVAVAVLVLFVVALLRRRRVPTGA
jgi:hypothetical protein